MAEPSGEAVAIKTSFGEIAAKGTTVVLLIALLAIGYLSLQQHSYRNSAENKIIDLLNHQNELLNDQTEALREGQQEIECQLGIDIFVHQFQRGGVDWDMLPAPLHGCYPEYAKKMPRPQK